MKRYIFIMTLAVISLCVSAHTKLTPETTSFLSLHGDLGYSALLHNIPSQPSAAGLNTNIGFDYRLFHNDFLFSIGVEGMYELNSNHIEEVNDAIRMMDTEGDLFDMHVQVEKSRDLTHMANVNIPILFGGEWKRFYFLIGPKISLNLYGMTSSTARITTYGEYERYYDDFYDMPNHQFESNQKMSSGTMPMKWNFNVMAHFEVGARFSHMYEHKQFRINPDKTRMYLAVYADFGVLNLYNNTGGAPTFDYRETDKGVQFFIQPLMLSNLSAGATFRNLNVGIKYTIAFEMPKRGKSYVYDYFEVESNYVKRGGNQTIRQ